MDGKDFSKKVIIFDDFFLSSSLPNLSSPRTLLSFLSALSSFSPDQAKSGATSPPAPVYAVVTNCTYDGLSVDCRKAEGLLGGVVDRLHFDEVRAIRISRWCALWHTLLCCQYDIYVCVCLLLTSFGCLSEVECVIIMPFYTVPVSNTYILFVLLTRPNPYPTLSFSQNACLTCPPHTPQNLFPLQTHPPAQAWWAYARFNQMYENRFAMRGDPKDHPKDGPTVFATQSTHKLLAALSQATFIHVREGRAAIPHHVFNEAYCLHTTTSPLYAISASNDISAAMMDGGGGKSLTDECIREAVAFRQSLMRAYREITQGSGSPAAALLSTSLTTTPGAGGEGGREGGGGGSSVTTRSADNAGSSSGRPNATVAGTSTMNPTTSTTNSSSSSALPAAAAKKASSSNSGKKGGNNSNGLTPGSWFFHPFNAWEVTDPATGNKIAFDHAKPDLLATEPRCWVLDPQASWHGFPAGSLEDGWCLLDPIKVAIVTPGMSPEGVYEKRGIPAPVVTAYLNERGIIVARTMSHMILFLFSIGITKGKWGTLLSALLAFRADYERNEPVSRVLPTLYEGRRDAYRGKGLRDLCDDMFLFNVRQNQQEVLHAAFERLPTPRMTPRAAFQQLMGTRIETLGLDALEGRTSGVCIIPYPPGIPLLISGEVISQEHVAYLRVMEAFDRAFPGFENEIQGVDTENLADGGYKITALVEEEEREAGRETGEEEEGMQQEAVAAGASASASASMTSSVSSSSLNSGSGQHKRRKT